MNFATKYTCFPISWSYWKTYFDGFYFWFNNFFYQRFYID